MEPDEIGRDFGEIGDWGWILTSFVYLIAVTFGIVRGAVAVEAKGHQLREMWDRERERWML